MRSLILLFLGVPIPIIILIALFVRQTLFPFTEAELKKYMAATATKKTGGAKTAQFSGE